MSKKDLSDEAALIVGFRVDKKSIRGWNQHNQENANKEIETGGDGGHNKSTRKFANKNQYNINNVQNSNSFTTFNGYGDVTKNINNIHYENSNGGGNFQSEVDLKSEGSMEEWYKAQYFDYYFKSYKANGLDDATSSQYAHTCVSELEKSGYIKNAIKSQMGPGVDNNDTKTVNFDNDDDKNSKKNGMRKRRSTFSPNGNNNNNQKLQNWIYKLMSTYRSNGTSEEDIEWNKKLSCYSSYIFEKCKASNKSIDWDLQKLPNREVIQNFKIKQEMEVEYKKQESQQLPQVYNPSFSGNLNQNELNNIQSGVADVQRFDLNSQSPIGNSNCKTRKRFTSKFESLNDNDKNDETMNTTNAKSDKEIEFQKSKKVKENKKKTRKLNVYINPCEDESNNKKDSRNSSYILDADGNKRLSWEQILALGRSTEKIIGLSTALEKPYLRLTASPDPNMVRPENILKKSLEFVLSNYLNYNFGSISSTFKYLGDNKRTNDNNERKKKYDWKYLEEQFRSIRQDLTVQGIKNNFTIQVYEMNGRIALENHDLGQFNQCQARLKELYSLNLVEFEHSNREEFLCYYIIYVTLQNMKTDIIRVLDEVQQYKTYRGIKFALQISKSVMDGNYRRYFMLRKNAPWESGHLLDIFRNRQLLIALTTMTKAFRFIEIPLITLSLGFNSNIECVSFLKSQNAIFTDNFDSNSNVNLESLKIDCKSSFPIFSSSPLLLNRKVQALG